MVAALLRRSDIDVNKRVLKGCSPIHHAARNGDTGLIRMLLACNRIDPNNLTRAKRQTALHIAASRGHLDIVKLLGNLIDINSGSSSKHTPLHLAAASGHTEVVKYLSSQDGIKINSEDRWQHTPLLLAAAGGHVEVAKYLINQDGVDVNNTSHRGLTLLHFAAQNGHTDMVKLLLDQNFTDPRCKDRGGNTPLHLSAFSGHWATVHVLLEHSKNHNISLNQSSGREECDRVEVVRRLLTHHDFENDNRLDFHWPHYSLLHIAAKKGEVDVIRFLLAHPNIDVNNKDKYGVSPLMVAAREGQLDAGRLLLEHKDIDINLRGPYGWPALESARVRGRKDFVDLLLSYGAKDDESNSSSSPREESNPANTTTLAEVHSDTPLEPGVEVQAFSFLDEDSDEESMDALNVNDTMDSMGW
ncbi:hypothetical protein N0V83_008980 [Neocucurbitaria cava]|uniref:Uncharacterized protein n=1 Tax=Neocucurbitaria cava TaxID=798079 RepID=A0A9W8Y104_9PLEO|nr:hypothetical protein N0V83_008980 [Neocucurbitaria cava]